MKKKFIIGFLIIWEYICDFLFDEDKMRFEKIIRVQKYKVIKAIIIIKKQSKK